MRKHSSMRSAKGIVESRDELTLLDNADAADPSLTQLVASAVSGLLPAGPELRQRPAMSLRGQPDIEVISLLCAASMGFTLHAATTVSAHEPRALLGRTWGSEQAATARRTAATQ